MQLLATGRLSCTCEPCAAPLCQAAPTPVLVLDRQPANESCFCGGAAGMGALMVLPITSTSQVHSPAAPRSGSLQQPGRVLMTSRAS